MKKLVILLIIFSLGIGATPVFAATKKTVAKPSFEKIFYYVPGEGSWAILDMHIQSIDVFAPQVYQVDSQGILTGKISDKVLTTLAKNKKIKIMPLVFQEGFDTQTMSTLLASPTTQDTFIDSLITEAKSKGYIGWQFDFEHMIATDRNAYSSFVERAAKKFHENKLILSVAVIGRTSEKPEDLPEGSWDYWAGVFDYKRIGKAADFITLMGYDEPASQGPVASIPWVKKALTYLEKSVPRKKISLGIPTYGWMWDVDTGKRVRSTGYDKILQLEVNNLYTKKGYDTTAQTAWITYSEIKDNVTKNYKIWYENARSFKVKYALAKSHGLRGVSLWALGLEDEEIFKLVK